MSKIEIVRYLEKVGEEYEKIIECRLYSNLDVIYEWWVPNTEVYHHQEMKFEDIAIEIQSEAFLGYCLYRQNGLCRN